MRGQVLCTFQINAQKESELDANSIKPGLVGAFGFTKSELDWGAIYCDMGSFKIFIDVCLFGAPTVDVHLKLPEHDSMSCTVSMNICI